MINKSKISLSLRYFFFYIATNKLGKRRPHKIAKIWALPFVRKMSALVPPVRADIP